MTSIFTFFKPATLLVFIFSILILFGSTSSVFALNKSDCKKSSKPNQCEQAYEDCKDPSNVLGDAIDASVKDCQEAVIDLWVKGGKDSNPLKCSTIKDTDKHNECVFRQECRDAGKKGKDVKDCVDKKMENLDKAGKPEEDTPCNKTKCDIIRKYVNPTINLLSVIFGIVAAGSIIMGGIQFSTSEGDPQKAARAKDRIAGTIIAIFAYAFIYAFLQFLIPGGLFNR